MTEEPTKAELEQAAAGVNTSAPAPEPHGEKGPLPFFQRAADARHRAHEALQAVEKTVGGWFTTQTGPGEDQ